MSGQDRPVRAVVDGRLPEFGEGDPDTVFANAVARAELRVAAARAATDAAADASREAARRSREVVRELRAEGYSVADTAAILGVSRGRISQLAHG